MNVHEKINYVELPARDIPATKTFFTAVFGWSFEDFGPEYTAFSNEGLDGGFFQSDKVSSASQGAALIVFYSEDLDSTKVKIELAGGLVIQPAFSFPGGRRFHFTDPNGNEFAVWSDKSELGRPMKPLFIVLFGLIGSWHFTDLPSGNVWQNLVAPLGVFCFSCRFLYMVDCPSGVWS